MGVERALLVDVFKRVLCHVIIGVCEGLELADPIFDALCFLGGLRIGTGEVGELVSDLVKLMLVAEPDDVLVVSVAPVGPSGLATCFAR